MSTSRYDRGWQTRNKMGRSTQAQKTQEPTTAGTKVNRNGQEGMMDGHLPYWRYRQQQQDKTLEQQLQTTSLYNTASSMLSGFVTRAAFAAAKGAATGNSKESAILDFLVEEVGSFGAMRNGVHSTPTASSRSQFRVPQQTASSRPPEVGASHTLQHPATLIMEILKPYFSVDDCYVKRKLLRLILPFGSSDWKRIPRSSLVHNVSQTPHSQQNEYESPRLDVNAPDLYIPIMSLLTFCLIFSVAEATETGQFNLQAVTEVMYTCIIIWVLEVAVFRVAMFPWMIQQGPDFWILDLFSYAGYKYVGLSLNSLVELICRWMLGDSAYGIMAYRVLFVWTVSATTMFLFRIFCSNTTSLQSCRRDSVLFRGMNRERAVLLSTLALSQFLVIWLLCSTRTSGWWR